MTEPRDEPPFTNPDFESCAAYALDQIRLGLPSGPRAVYRLVAHLHALTYYAAKVEKLEEEENERLRSSIHTCLPRRVTGYGEAAVAVGAGICLGMVLAGVVLIVYLLLP